MRPRVETRGNMAKNWVIRHDGEGGFNEAACRDTRKCGCSWAVFQRRSRFNEAACRDTRKYRSPMTTEKIRMPGFNEAACRDTRK